MRRWEFTEDGARGTFIPKYDLLERLLEVPLAARGDEARSGMPAKAIDVWVAHEMRQSWLPAGRGLAPADGTAGTPARGGADPQH